MTVSRWREPATIIAVAGLVLSVFTFATGRIDQARISELEQGKLELERSGAKLDARLKLAEAQRQENADVQSQQSRAELQVELKKIKTDIGRYEQSVFENELALAEARSHVVGAKKFGKPEQDNARMALTMVDAALASANADLAKATARRKEIEDLLKQPG